MMISITIGTGTKIIRNLHHQALNHRRILLHFISSLWLPPRVPSSLASYSSTCHNTDKKNTMSSSISGPSQQLKSWESGAKLIKNISVENQYLEHIRDVHDPSMHLKTIEDELKGTIGKALGKQGQKVLMYARLMNEERQRYEDLIRDYYRNNNDDDNNGNNENDDNNEEEIRSCVVRHNDYRKDCIHSRWELIVHRQAVGFTVGNQRYVMERFPIGVALPLELVPVVDEREGSKDNGDDTKNNRNNNHSYSSSSEKISCLEGNKENLVGQLEWWEKIGRWR
jgi:hypothetical protein